MSTQHTTNPAYDASFVGFYCLDILGVPVEVIPPGGQCYFIDDIRLTVAGTAGGSVVDAAKLGINCLALGAVGDDEKADFMLSKLESFGVDTSVMRRYPGVSTSSSILTIRPDGSRPALHVRGVSDRFELSEAAMSKAIDAKVVHFGGTGLLAKLDGQPTVDLMQAAKKAGRITTYDLIAARKETVELVLPVLPFVDYFMPSIDEAAVMCGNDNVDYCADYFLAAGAKVVAISLGADGSLIAGQNGERFHVPAHDIQVLDTTGCGDAYSAGFVVGLVKGMDLEQCARFATACGALVATGLGSDAGILSFDDTMKAMNNLPKRGR
ncbi:carbohydrate kinase family protein [Serratia rhizosphaerae]|uniref:Sugar kinase n=1 Tax=Serratia rhizosphaerae TaxID=2597702 RepID=A0ABX6GPC6_9GAMM|nr:sugar kinase [Serratia rhizosphaerae]QHA88055.1 sugar kinase [Serratia rhizosphaerae]